MPGVLLQSPRPLLRLGGLFLIYMTLTEGVSGCERWSSQVDQVLCSAATLLLSCMQHLHHH
jgi:hypothetical protein